MAVNYKKFKDSVNLDDLKKMEDRFENQNSGGNYEELPSGTYAVEVDKLEVGQSSWGSDQVNITFKIIDGDHAGQLIFYNGTFDEHFAHGKPQTASLISDMTDNEADKFLVLGILDGGVDTTSDFLLEVYQDISSRFTYDLEYTVNTSKKINPNTNKPYVNKFFKIVEIYDA